jgi:hypothetical protein
MTSVALKKKSFYLTAILVVLFHGLGIGWSLLAFRTPAPTPKLNKPLTVQTVRLSKPAPAPVPSSKEKTAPAAVPPAVVPKEPPPPSIAKTTPAPLPAKKNTEKKEEPKQKKEELKAKKEEPKPPKKIADAPKSSPNQDKKKELIAKAQESIAKIQPTRDKINADKIAEKTELKIPQLKGKNAEAGKEKSVELGYEEELISLLQLFLRLPEHGQVKIELTLARTGKTLKMEVINALSESNRQYVQREISSIAFPPFGHRFGNEAHHKFLITLSSEL